MFKIIEYLIINPNEKQKRNATYFFHIFLSLLNIIFLVYVMMVGYYNRPALDDYCQLKTYHELGVFKGIWTRYQEWSISVVLTPISMFIIGINQNFSILFLYIVVLSVSFILSFYHLIRPVQRNILQLNSSIWINVNLAGFSFLILFNMFFQSSTYFWLIASVGYCLPLIFILYTFMFLIITKKRWWYYLLAAICPLFVSNGPINFAITYLYILFILLLIIITNKVLLNYLLFNKNISSQIFKKILFLLSISIIGISITLLSPGVYIRKAQFPEISIIETLLRSLNGIFQLQDLIQGKLKYLIMIVILFIYFGTTKRNYKKVNETIPLILVFIGFPFLLSVLWIAILPTIYAIGTIGPLRSLTHVSLYIVVFSVILGFSIGYHTLFSKKLAFILASITCFYLLGITTKRIVSDIPQVVRYANSYDQRIDYILRLKTQQQTDTVTLMPLAHPNYDIIVTDEFSESPEYWVNTCFQEAFELEFPVKK